MAGIALLGGCRLWGNGTLAGFSTMTSPMLCDAMGWKVRWAMARVVSDRIPTTCRADQTRDLPGRMARMSKGKGLAVVNRSV